MSGKKFQELHQITKREWFAGMALQSIIARWTLHTDAISEHVEVAIGYADEMIRQLGADDAS